MAQFEYEFLLERKRKNQILLLELIAQKDEEGALILLFDKTLEVNAEIHNQDYIPLNCAIKNGLIKLVKESYTHPEIKDKLNINRKNNKAFNESLVLAQSNSIELYEFFEEMKIDKLELINDTLFYALGFGKIKLIKHLINKRVNGEYAPINFQRAIIGYDSVDYDNKERDKDFFVQVLNGLAE